MNNNMDNSFNLIANLYFQYLFIEFKILIVYKYSFLILSQLLLSSKLVGTMLNIKMILDHSQLNTIMINQSINSEEKT